jgi:hypothetical protein
MMAHVRRWLAGLFVAGMLMAPAAGNAMEPQNDAAPWKWSALTGDTTMYSSDQPSRWTWWWWEEVASSSDVDHVLLTCNGRTVLAAGIQFYHSKGDLDIYVYDIAGNLLGSSQGVADTERVDVRAFGKQAVVVKVYGYNGATGRFGPQVDCS